MKTVALFVSGAVFLFVSALHFLRYAKGWQIVVDNFTVPVDWSIYGGIIALLLAVWMFVAAKR